MDKWPWRVSATGYLGVMAASAFAGWQVAAAITDLLAIKIIMSILCWYAGVFVGSWAAGFLFVTSSSLLRSLWDVREATQVAARIAGSRRNVGDAWLADLMGDPDTGQVPTPKQQRRLAFGFFASAIRYRLHDWFSFAAVPLDWMLRSKPRREGAVAGSTGALVIYIVATDGLHTMLTYGWAWTLAQGTATWLVLGWLGRLRGIELASDNDPPTGE